MQLEEPPVHAKDPPVVTPAFPRRQTAPSIPYSATSRSKKSLFSRSNTPGNRSKYYSAVGITRNDAPPDPPVDAPLPPAPVVIPPTFGEGASSSDSSDREDDRSDSDQARTPSASVHNDSFDEVSMLHDGADQGRFRHSIGSDATAGVVSPMMSPSDSPKFDLVTRSWSNANLSELVPEYGRQTPSLPVDVLINCAEDMFRSSFAGDFGLDVDECVEVTSPTGGAVVFDPISIPFAQDVMIPPPSSGACDVNTVTVTTAPVDDFILPPFPPNPITPLVSALPPKPVPLGPKRLVPSRLDTDRGRNEFVSWEQVRSDLSTLFPVAPTSPDANLALSTVTTTPEEPEGVTSLSSRLQQLWAGGGGPMGTGTPPTVIGSSNTSPPRVAFDTDLRASGDSSNYEGRTQADIGRFAS